MPARGSAARPLDPEPPAERDAEVAADLEALEPHPGGQPAGDFVVDDLSNWYVRLQPPPVLEGRDGGGQARRLRHALHGARGEPALLAPFIPFTTEEIYRALHGRGRGEVSVHLSEFPTAALRLSTGTSSGDGRGPGGRGTRAGPAPNLDPDAATARTLLMHRDDHRVARLMPDDCLKGDVAEELNVKWSARWQTRAQWRC